NLDADESPFDTKSEIKFIRKEVPKFIYNGSHVNKDATKGFSLSNQVIQKADSDLESMPSDETDSLSGFESFELDDEVVVDNILYELANMNHLNENVNAFTHNTSESDPLSHLHKEISYL
ncbi:hypothetical protein Tco_1088914, partial [Tanacetum coccineum]